MAKKHDFKRFPELSNSQMGEFYFDSPHKQITNDIRVRVVDVHDGDTIRVKWSERKFTFPIRLANLAAPELDEEGGTVSQKQLSREILNKEVDVILTRTRVEKWGRLLAYILHGGFNMSELQIANGNGVSWKNRKSQGRIEDFIGGLELPFQ